MEECGAQPLIFLIALATITVNTTNMTSTTNFKAKTMDGEGNRVGVITVGAPIWATSSEVTL
jgi:hypothetical protein